MEVSKAPDDYGMAKSGDLNHNKPFTPRVDSIQIKKAASPSNGASKPHHILLE
jgi:hypothetical protein